MNQPKPLLCSITFDDGVATQYTYAKPILDRFNIKASFYIITKNLFNADSDPYYMKRSEVLALHREGHEIGAHTVTHPNLSRTFLWKGNEIGKCKRDLQKVGIQSESFAYPFGEQNWLVRKLVRLAGYKNARIAGYDFDAPQDVFRVEAMSIQSGITPDDVATWVKEASENNRLPVLVFHEVQLLPKIYGCTPDFLSIVCSNLIDSGMQVLPLSRALAIKKHHDQSQS